MEQRRSAKEFEAWAVIDKKYDAVALHDCRVPIFWLRKLAQDRCDEFNDGDDFVKVAKVRITRLDK